MTAEEYVQQELTAGHLTAHHIVAFVEAYQKERGLVVDGKPGPLTRADVENQWRKPAVTDPDPQFLQCPLPVLKAQDGSPRHAVMTSGFHTVNPDRPTHNGCDWFYPYQAGDQPSFVGNHGAATKQPNGLPKWVVPYQVCAIAAADGVVTMAGNSPTGYRVWVDHGNGWRTGYFHLLDIIPHVGDKVKVGDPLGPVGDNPQDTDARHLHFELSPVDRYAPVDPMPHIKA